MTTHTLIPTDESNVNDLEMTAIAIAEPCQDSPVAAKPVDDSNKGDLYRPIRPETAPVTLTWKDLVVTTKVSKSKVQKQLLNNISGSITGGLWAIMGSSGSGKTTFLSCLSYRLDTFRMSMSGEIRMNGHEYSKKELKSMSGYVMQDDLIHASLTVEETLRYTAELRMPPDLSIEERKSREEYILKLMGISYCRNTIVGDTRNKGISGGERKRLCIAMELLTKPSLLFLDEPTSGLDSTTALSVMETLKGLASRGECTVVSTIHQPQTKIFNLFDNLILMKSGNIVYQGNAANSLNYFERMGFPCPPMTNPADFLIDIISDFDNGVVVSPEAKKAASERLDKIDSQKFVPYIEEFGGTGSMFNIKEWKPWWHQFSILFRRNMHFHIRRLDIFATNIFVTMLIATFCSLSVWRHMGTGKASGSKRQAALFFCVIHQGIVASLQGTHSFPLERAIMLRERQAGAYYVSAYFIAKTVADFVMQVPAPIVFTCTVYPIIGFRPTADQFFIFMAFMILDAMAATSLANMISCICVSIEMSTVVLALAYEWVRLYGGWFMSPAMMVSYPEWKFADALSYIKYAFVGISLNENSNLILHCAPSERTPAYASGAESISNCKIPPLTTYPYDGAAYNAYYGYDQFTIAYCAGMLIIYIVGCRLFAYLGLRFIKI